MQPRRHFVRLALALGATAIASRAGQAHSQASQPIWLPLVQAPLADGALLGPATGTTDQAIAWLVARSSADYPLVSATEIVNAYQQLGDSAGMDWFLAIAQMAHETGSLTSWWSQRPRRNPAGIGVTGRTQAGSPDVPPEGARAWDESIQKWREGASFQAWFDQRYALRSVPAHLGRLLAYALRDDEANPAQLDLIGYALSIRPLPASYRGVATTIIDLNGRWAVPGTDYGQRILDLARRMREG
jgi:hypothetical protein